jgi:DNA modification methylase
MIPYQEFLKSKEWTSPKTGLEVVPQLNENLFDWQRDIVDWALKRGRACLFLSTGLGKTFQQLEWAQHVPGDVIIVAPLAVSGQTVQEGKKFGIEAVVSKDGSKKGKITVTNYEQVHKFDPAEYEGVVLDESSILKSHDGKYRTELINSFSETIFRLACTATPAPNDVMELANHAEFVGLMKRQEFLATWFVHDGGNTSKWRLKKHAEKPFWDWVATWAVMMKLPSDLGYKDDGFVLPPLTITEHMIETGIRREGELLTIPARGLKEQRKARRDTLDRRVSEAANIIRAHPGPWVVWCELNDESSALAGMISGAIELKGPDSAERKEEILFDFSSGKIPVLVTKPKIAAFGLNWQHCSHQCFVGLSHSFEQFFQAVRRSWRFGQRKEVNIHVIVTDLEQDVVTNVKQKHDQHENMSQQMAKSMADRSIEEIKGVRRRVEDYSTKHVGTDKWDLYRGDCVEEIKVVNDNSVGLSIFSPPFAQLYTYSSSDRDMGNCKDANEFMLHFFYLVKELLRVTMPGRLCCVHCMDLPIMKSLEGYIGLKDFSGNIIECFLDNDWYYHGKITVWKDPVVEMQRTKALGLLHKQLKKDSAMSRPGIPDYIVLFRKPGDNPEPIAHTPEEFSVSQWQEWASPVWMNINQSDTLQKRSAREDKDEKHIAPLQLEPIRRMVKLWSNPGDLVLDPFAGIGSTGYVALQEERRFVGFELKESYYKQAVNNLKNVRLQIAFEW